MKRKRLSDHPLPLSNRRKNCWFSNKESAKSTKSSMATIASSSSFLLFSSPKSKLTQSSLSPSLRLPFSSSSHFSSSLSISPQVFSCPTCSRRSSLSSFTVKASAAEKKKKVLIVNTNSGAHAVIGFYFAKGLLGSGHEVTIMTVGDENSDKMKKPPFNRFNVREIFLEFSFTLYYNFFNSSSYTTIFLTAQAFRLNGCSQIQKTLGNCECWRQDGVGRASRSSPGCGRCSI